MLGALAVLGLLLAVASPWLGRRVPDVWWALCGYPVAAVRVVSTWRRLADLQNLSVAKRPALAVFGGVVLRGRALRPVKPKIGFPRWQRGGLVVRVRLHAGQTPEVYAAAAESMAHAWQVFAVRAVSDSRGSVTLSANAWDPLSMPTTAFVGSLGVLSAAVGLWEDGQRWVVDLRKIPHWLIMGATQSGKSTLMASLVSQWARQPVALVGIDLKGGMELSLFERRLTALATNRKQAVVVLERLVDRMAANMALCRAVGARSIWELSEQDRPVPVVVLVDEVAELYLMATTGEKAEVAQVSTAMLRVGQLGAALGVHLVVAGQRVGSDLGPGVTALRAQLAGRICFRVSDKGTAEMVIGDDRDAVAIVQGICVDQPGVAVALAAGGGWARARTDLVTPQQAQEVAERFAHLAPSLSDLGMDGAP